MILKNLKQGLGFCMLILMASCQSNTPKETLPILGEKDIKTSVVDGKTITDTIYHTIPPFRFMDQDSLWVSQDDLKGKIYLTDFFFTRCPTICPILSKNMLVIAQKFENDPRVALVSHTIDAHFDTPPVLREYAEKLGAPANWRFLHGDQDTIYEIAGQAGYFSFATEDENVAGGFDHSGALTLVDKKGRVRGVYDGTKEEDTMKALRDMEILLAED